MARLEKDLTRGSVWWGPGDTKPSHVPYREGKADRSLLVNDDRIVLVNNFLFQGREPPKQIHVTLEWKGPDDAERLPSSSTPFPD